jgi:uncharacterized protein YbbC (DUF1343 family)
MRLLAITILLLQGLHGGCRTGFLAAPDQQPSGRGRELSPLPGAACFELYLPLIRGKNIAIVANHTSVVAPEVPGKDVTVADNHKPAVPPVPDHKNQAANRLSTGEDYIHLVDTLLSYPGTELHILRVFAPEHGFRGEKDAGALVEDGRDPATGIPVISLYGDHRKPGPDDLEGLDVVLFDLQDVGSRFYTYISTLHYVMEACAENGVPLMVLDRPNPNGGYVDGPLLEPEFTSFVGMHSIPVVYGLTMGELARMINGEGWLTGGIRCELTVVPCRDYDHGMEVALPVAPSPNLATLQAIRLYPSTCFFEGTILSEGRGTNYPFEVFGHPDLPGEFSFTPRSMPGRATRPKLEGQICYGKDLREYKPDDGWTRLHLGWLLEAYGQFPDKNEFFTPYFESLAGTATLRRQITAGWDESRIRVSWEEDLEKFRRTRLKYLLYP